MKKHLTKFCSVMLLGLVMFLSVVRVNANAAVVNITKNELQYFVSVSSTNSQKYPAVKIYLGKKYINANAYLINDTTYIPLRAVAEIAGADVSYNASSRTAIISMSGLYMTVSDGSYISYANGRALASPSSAVILDDGRMYVPVRIVAKALSLDVEWYENRTVVLGGTATPLASADEFYDPDELYWLSRIISAEAQGEKLLGQIAVGNVVLNRVASPDFPNTIYSVIFDRKHGVQFSPILNGTIYEKPSYTSVVAAKLCLEGFSVSPDILFFMEPSKSTSSWIANTRKYAFTIQNHYFFY